MDLSKSGKLLRALRKEKGLTQKELADKLGIVPKTVSKWETGHGFPDVSTLSTLANILGVSEKSLLAGYLPQNRVDSGNIRRTKFYVCPYFGCIMQGVGECQMICCGKTLQPLQTQAPDESHTFTITEIDDEFYLQFPHETSKEHFICFVAYVGFDRVFTWRLYPEQDCAVRIPKVYSGKIVYYCNRHGLFEYSIKTHLCNL